MNPSVSLQCEKAMVALLQGADFAVQVYRSSTQEFSIDLMPAYNLVRTETENVDGNQGSNDSLAVIDRWQLMCYAAGSGVDEQFDAAGNLLPVIAATEAVDALTVYAHQQLQDQTLGGLCRWARVVGSKCYYDTRSGQDCIEVAMQVEVHYDIARMDPSQNFNAA